MWHWALHFVFQTCFISIWKKVLASFSSFQSFFFFFSDINIPACTLLKLRKKVIKINFIVIPSKNKILSLVIQFVSLVATVSIFGYSTGSLICSDWINHDYPWFSRIIVLGDCSSRLSSIFDAYESVCSFQTAKLSSFRRNNGIWQIGLVFRASSVTSHQTSRKNRRISVKGYSIPRDFSWIENYKLSL